MGGGASTYCVSPGASHAFHFLLFEKKKTKKKCLHFFLSVQFLFLYFIVENVEEAKKKLVVDLACHAVFFFREDSKTCAPHIGSG